jgi:F-type H+-transporting ATPase subunit epsilon
MAEGIALKIVTPEGVGLDMQVLELTAPGESGQFGVLPGHRPLLAALRTGIVSYVAEGETRSLAVGPGFVEVIDDRAVLLTQRFVAKQDVDPVAARRELREADEALQGLDAEGADYARWVTQSLWAATELELYGDPPPAKIHVAHELDQLGHAKMKGALQSADPSIDELEGDSD